MTMTNAEKEAAGLAYFGVTGRGEDQPSQITNLIYSDPSNAVISATENGVHLSIPAVAGNRHFDEIVERGLVIAAYAAPEKTWADIRGERDALLHASDWMAMADRTITEAQSSYRQALRDIPQDFADPAAVVWPTPPDG